MLNQYQPIYNLDCVECDRTPVVSFFDQEGDLQCTQLCGVCFFGDRLMQDPDEWNQNREATE